MIGLHSSFEVQEKLGFAGVQHFLCLLYLRAALVASVSKNLKPVAGFVSWPVLSYGSSNRLGGKCFLMLLHCSGEKKLLLRQVEPPCSFEPDEYASRDHEKTR